MDHHLTAAQTDVVTAEVMAERVAWLETLPQDARVKMSPDRHNRLWIKKYDHPLYPWSTYVWDGGAIHSKIGDMFTSSRLVEECDTREFILLGE